MATLNINGQSVKVDDSFLTLPHDEQQSTVDEIASSLKSSAPAEGSSLSGLAKSLGVGALQGTAGLASDASSLLAEGSKAVGDYIGGKFGFAPSPPLGPNVLPSSATIGKLYEPKGEAEQIANRVGQFLPGVIGGPESLAIKLATRVAAPALATEAAGALTGGNPYAEIGGALIGAGGATAAVRKFQELAAARAAARAIPTGDELVKLGSNQFDQARNMDVAVKPDFAKNTVQEMRAALKDYDPEQIKPVLNAVGRLDDLYKPTPPNIYNTLHPVAPTPPIDMNQVELVRKQLSGLRTSPDATLRTAAKTAQEVITKNQMALTAADAASGDAPLYAKTIRDAVGNYGAGKRSNAVTGKMDLAELNAGTAGSGANADNAARQAIKQLARPINNTNVPVAKKLGFIDPEVDAIKKAAMGTVVGNTARYLGKGAPTGIVSAAGGIGVGHMAGGPLGAVALPVASYVAKKIGDLSTKRAISALDSLVRSRSPHAVEVAAQLPPQIVGQLPTKTLMLLRSMAFAAPPLRQAIQPMTQPIGQPATQ